MANPKGNPGNKGGGRKSHYQELADARDLFDIWNGKKSKKQLQEIIESGKYGVKHVMAAKCMSGDRVLIAKLMDKLYANKDKVEHSGEIDSNLIIHILDK